MLLPILEQHPDCTACELHEVANHVGIGTIFLEDSLPPSTTTPAVLFIGQNPGFHEDEKGVPFIGKSGRILRGGYNPETGQHEPGIYVDGINLRSLASVYIANAVRCFTMDNAKPTHGKHVKPCFPHLLADILSIHAAHFPAPLYLFLLGATAVESVSSFLLPPYKKSSLDGAFKSNGALHSLSVPSDPYAPPPPKLKKKKGALPPAPEPVPTTPISLRVFATFHPAALDRNPNYIHAIEGHLQLLLNALTGRTPSVTRPHLIPVRYPHHA